MLKTIKGKKTILFFVILMFGVIIGLCISARFNLEPTLKSATLADTEKTPAKTSVSYPFENAIINVAETAGKAVVSISAQTSEQSGNIKKRASPFGEGYSEDDPLKKFFDEFFGELPQREFKRIGLGSGVIIDPDGYILTNEHVVRDADKLTVKLSDGREFNAKVKGSDPLSDLAVIVIEAKNLPTIPLGDSNNLKIGQWVVAVGNPFGFSMQNPEPTVTLGVVSALHRSLGRSLGRDKDYSDLIQTDAAINPGNSGGPLVNLDAEVIGINVAIFSTSGGYEGIGFAIPINSAKRIVSKLIKGEEIVYGWLGITIQNVDQKLAEYLGLPSTRGVLVVNALKGGPAEKAGVKSSDVIIEFESKEVKDTRDLLKFVQQASVGSRVKIVVLRDRQKQALQVEIGKRPNQEELASGVNVESKKAQDKWRGLAVVDINENISRRFHIDEASGVAVVEVEPNSPADDAGLVVGDVIVEFNKEKVANKNDFDRIKKNVKGNCLLRAGRGYFVISTQ